MQWVRIYILCYGQSAPIPVLVVFSYLRKRFPGEIHQPIPLALYFVTGSQTNPYHHEP